MLMCSLCVKKCNFLEHVDFTNIIKLVAVEFRPMAKNRYIYTK